MTIAEINIGTYGSTGNIMLSIQKEAAKNSFSVISFYGENVGKTYDSESVIRVGNDFYNNICCKFAHLTGLFGCYSIISTQRLLNEFKKKDVNMKNTVK
jgi:hypothetical protein